MRSLGSRVVAAAVAGAGVRLIATGEVVAPVVPPAIGVNVAVLAGVLV